MYKLGNFSTIPFDKFTVGFNILETNDPKIEFKYPKVTKIFSFEKYELPAASKINPFG